MDILKEARVIAQRNADLKASIRAAEEESHQQAIVCQTNLWDVLAGHLHRLEGQTVGQWTLALVVNPREVGADGGMILWALNLPVTKKVLLWVSTTLSTGAVSDEQTYYHPILTVQAYSPSGRNGNWGAESVPGRNDTHMLSISRMNEMPKLLQFVAEQLALWMP